VLSQGNNNKDNRIKQQRQQPLQQYEEQKQEHMTTNKAIKKILLINAEIDVSLALKLALEEDNREYGHGYFKVNCFNDPILALKNFKNDFYDLVMVDIVIPNMNGIELSERIRKIDNNVKICFLTAGEVSGKVRFDPYHHTNIISYEDKFIKLPIENEMLVSLVEGMIES
jgi:two-component SAPR family response regulator